MKSVRTQTMKIVMYTMEPRLRASPRHGGQVFFKLYVTDPLRGRPFGSSGNHHNYYSGTGPALNLNNPIFIGIENRPDDRRS